MGRIPADHSPRFHLSQRGESLPRTCCGVDADEQRNPGCHPGEARASMGTLYYGDNLEILREHVKDETVDLVYLGPPFNSNASYNVLFKAPKGHQSHAQMEAFEDPWHWDGN